MSTLLVTTTHGRPQAFAALQEWVKNQTTDDFHWLIVCDNWEDYKFPKDKKHHVIKRDPADDTMPSICHNWLVAIDWIEQHEDYDRVIVLEDDDWYCREYVQETKRLLDKAELVGWNEDAYYYVHHRKARRVHNIVHASLACTAFKRSVLPYLKECCSKGDIFIDALLWQGIRSVSLVKQLPVALPDGRTMDVPPIPVSNVIRKFEGETLLADNFTGIVHGSGQQPEIINDKTSRESGNIRNEHPRHVGMKENWHGGAFGLSSRGHDPMTGGGWDMWGAVLKKWLGEKDAGYFLKFTRDPRNPGGKGESYGPYQEGLLLSLPVEAD